MKTRSLCLQLLLIVTIPMTFDFVQRVRADVITGWNGIAIPLIRTSPNVTATRQLALVHVAQFDAVNAVVGKYAPYLVNIAAPAASPEAAAAQAAHDVLVRLFPTNQAALDAALNSSLAAIANSPAKTDGIMLGTVVAAQIWNLRASDGTALVVSNAFPGGPGLWSQTPGGPATPVSQQYAYATPWALRGASQFRPGPPPSLNSAPWANDFNEIKALGATNSVTRTPEQTDIGLFIIEFPFFLLNEALKQALVAQPMSLVDTARAFALMHMVSADAGIAVWDAKYAYNFWRPVTAIRAADTDGNDATSPNPDWLPLRATPGHPEYPCAHCTISAAMTTVLAALFGDDFTFTLESATLPGKPRTFHRFSEYAALSLEGRLYAGFHYRNSSMVGLDLGAKVANYALRNLLTPGPTLAGSLEEGHFRLATRNLGSLAEGIETSSDLVTWSPLTNYTRMDLTLEIFVTNAVAGGQKFYRAVSR